MANPVAAEDGPSHRYGWLDEITKKIDNLSPVSNWSIWKVPHSLRTVNDDAYNPHIISIGPLRRGELKLQSMEVHKLYYMRSLLQRTPDLKERLKSSAEAIEKFEEMIRACYAEPINLKPSELAETLLVDGCFMLELFIRYSKVDLRVQDDPLFYSSWMILTLQRDLSLLENQIPFFVLENLYSLVVESSTIGQSLPSLPELALGFFKSILYLNKENFRIIKRPYPHLLDLIHNCYLPSATPVRNNIRERVSTQPATSLYEAGIEFRKGTTRNLFDLKFRNGVLEIPPLLIHDSTVSLFQNLIAYEQLSRGTPQYITSYFALMSRLVYDRRDAKLLESKGIIENDMSGWKDVSVLFNDMCKQVVVQDFYYAELCQDLNSPKFSLWALYRTNLRRNSRTTAVRNNTREWVSTQPATSLDAAGIVFRKRTARNLFDLKFRHAALRQSIMSKLGSEFAMKDLGPLSYFLGISVTRHSGVDTKAKLSMSSGNPYHDPTEYRSLAALMSRLVYDRRDAELLESKGIIENDMSGWKDVSVLFNDMCKQVVGKDFYYAELCQDLNSNFRTHWALYMATLRKTYFRSPWAVLSITAACVLLILTVTRTIYALA
ncbi:hypothetical protein DKX38_020244 [Salix brachista]|uniref:Reverse transcriptase Ty1/copia-type domain-containing protein n=1 Tax=Salix brachista TaxID=2182728 RepID=A0A5N5KIF8_9ROSI|nr:hypothetical protein DKX38_020244 [Salix brachista]